MAIANHRGAGGRGSGWNVKRRHAADYKDTRRIRIEEVVKLCAAISHWLPLSPLLFLSFSYKLLLHTFCSLSAQPCLILFMFLSVLSHRLSLVFTTFLSQLALFRQEGPLYFLRCLGVPGPASLRSVCVCTCVSQLANSCHIQPSHAAQLRLTATVNFFSQSLSLIPPFINNYTTDPLWHFPFSI